MTFNITSNEPFRTICLNMFKTSRILTTTKMSIKSFLNSPYMSFTEGKSNDVLSFTASKETSIKSLTYEFSTNKLQTTKSTDPTPSNKSSRYKTRS